MAVAHGYSSTSTSGSVFIYDTGDTFNSFRGIPVVNCAKDLTSGYNITVTEVTDGSIAPPFAGMRVYKFVPTNASNLHRQGGYYDGGGFGGSNANPLLLGRTSPSNFTTVGTGKYRFGMYVRGDVANGSGTGITIDIGDRNHVSTTIGSSSEWQLIQTNDSAGINDSSYPYDFFDIGASYPMTFYVAGYGIWRNIGTVDSLPALQAYPQGTQYITYQQTRSVSGSLLDISGYANSINLSNISFSSSAQPVFDGTDDYIDFGTVSGGIGGSSQATMELVINMTFPNTYQQIFGFRNDTTFDFFFLVFGGGGTEFRVRNSAGTYYDLNPSISAYSGNPVHVVFTVGPNGRQVYFNGAVAATSGTWTGTLGSSAPFNIGRNAGNVWFANGTMPVAKLYNRALTAGEVLNNFNHYKTRFNIN